MGVTYTLMEELIAQGEISELDIRSYPGRTINVDESS